MDQLPPAWERETVTTVIVRDTSLVKGGRKVATVRVDDSENGVHGVSELVESWWLASSDEGMGGLCSREAFTRCVFSPFCLDGHPARNFEPSA